MPSSTLLADFELPISSSKFLQIFWIKDDWYKSFLCEQLNDLEVSITSWTVVNEQKHRRNVRSLHPSQISFPGLPSHAESDKLQTYEIVDGVGSDNLSIIITECDNIKGIPYADYFSVQTEWKIIPNYNSTCNSCHIIIQLSFIFHKSTWLQGTIESNSRAEMLRVYELWMKHAMLHIEDLKNANELIIHSNTEFIPRVESVLQLENRTSVLRLSCADLTLHDRYNTMNNITSPSSPTMASRLFGLEKEDSGNILSSTQMRYHVEEENDGDEMYYDCEDNTPRQSRVNSRSALYSNEEDGEVDEEEEDEEKEGKGMNDYVHLLKGHNGKPLTTRDVAITIVESWFVIIEFVFWAVYHFYMYELKDIFNIKPKEVMIRICQSIVPGRHRNILRYPDMYGPIMAVLLLPQVLMLSMEFSLHGCSQVSLLGNSIVVTICLWFGLAGFYRY